MDPTELMMKARQSDELAEALQGAVILAGAAGEAGGAVGGACPGFVVISETFIEDSLIEKLREVAQENSGDQEVQVLFARAHG